MKFLPTRFSSLIFILALVIGASAQTPAPSPTASPLEIKPPAQTISFLKSQIAMALADPSLRRGQVGVKIVSMRTGETVYERNAQNYFMPASNMKSFTVAAAIDRLSPGFRFKTSVYSSSEPDPNGTLIGDLVIFGRGDPTFSEAFSEDQPYKRFDELADAIIAAGVKTISGSIVGDETFFDTSAIPFGWEWDDLQWYYGAEISSLSIFDNAVELKILPSTAGSQCVVQTTPVTRFVRIINKTKTVAAGEKKKLRVTKLLGQNVIEVAGTMPENDKGYSGRVAFSKPAELFAEVLSNRLRMKGVEIKGGIRTIDREDRGGARLPFESYKEITSTLSPPLSIIAAKTMKPSQNLYTELLLRTLGETATPTVENGVSSEKKGIDAVQELLGRAGVEPRSVVQYDGSGLSRHNLITPDSAVKLYMFMDRGSNAIVWRNSLTVGGVDGTLRNRFKGTSAEGNVRGKTGTLDQVSALSGYVDSKSGERFVFSVLTNYIPNSRLRTSTIDKIVVLLGDYDGVLERSQ